MMYARQKTLCKPTVIEQTHSPHAERFIERLGQLAEGENLPRTAGRLMALLILSGTPLGIDEIAKRLHVSRASVSTNSRLLQTLGIAQLARQPGNRRDYLQISGDPPAACSRSGCCACNPCARLFEKCDSP